MKHDILGIEGFLAVAQHGGFQSGAQALHISQTALTRRLQKLEAQLGVTLVERTTRSVVLTEVGREFLPQAQRLLADLSAVVADLQEIGKARRGGVTVASIPTVGVRYLPAVIRAYAARYPGNRVRILDDRLSPGVTEAVLRREAEFGINVAEAAHPDLASVPLVRDRFVVVCRDDHPLAGRARLPWRELAPHTLIAPGPASANRSFLDLVAREHGLPLRPFYEVQRSSTAVGLAAEGVAAALVPRLAVEPAAHPRLRVIDLVEPTLARTVVLLSRKRAQLSPAAAALYEMMRTRPRRSP